MSPNDQDALQLFADGNPLAQKEVGEFDTGAWSLYSRAAVTRESDLNYHTLVTGFLTELCKRTQADSYCGGEQRFKRYLKEGPKIKLERQAFRGGKTKGLRFGLSKVSRVTVRITHGDKVVFSRGFGLLAYGNRSVNWTPPKRAGSYDVRVTAVDLAGHSATSETTVDVLGAKGK